MFKIVKARIVHGQIEPLEPLPFDEGTEVEVTGLVSEEELTEENDPTQSTAGAWSDLLDCEEFEKNIRASIVISNSPEEEVR